MSLSRLGPFGLPISKQSGGLGVEKPATDLRILGLGLFGMPGGLVPPDPGIPKWPTDLNKLGLFGIPGPAVFSSISPEITVLDYERGFTRGFRRGLSRGQA